MTITTELKPDDYSVTAYSMFAYGDDADDSFLPWDYVYFYSGVPFVGGWYIYAGGGNDTIFGSMGDDAIRGDDGDDVLSGAGGDDRLFGGEGADQLFGGDDDDYLSGGVEGETILTGGDWWADKGEYIDGGAGNDEIYGCITNDTLLGGSGDDKLFGGEGNDYLDGGSGNNEMRGGLGDDTYVVRDEKTDHVIESFEDGGRDTVVLLGHTYTMGGIEDLRVDSSVTFGTSIVGNDDHNHILGGAGNDVIKAMGGNDHIDGMGGNDMMYGGLGNDEYVVEQSGDMVFEDANAGTDTVYSLMSSFTLGNNIENIWIDRASDADATGNDMGNVMTGNNWVNTLTGLAGNDTIDGRAGDDWLYGGEGNDDIRGGIGIDHLWGDAGADVLRGELGMDYMWGGSGSDTLWGGSDMDILHGDAGNDQLHGELGNDYIYGDAGTDFLWGEDGNDVLAGGAGRDYLTGGAGNDTFRYSETSDSQATTQDYVYDFVRGQDRIDLSGIDANTTLSGNQAFSFSANKPFFTSAGDLWLETVGRAGNTSICGDVNGDGLEDLRIELVGNYANLSAADLIV
jgi:Ca2+-binding RTX toxin-like protein